MRTQLFVPLVTYPDAISEAIAKNAVAVAAELSGDLNVVTFNAHIPDVTNVWSRMLINIPQMILAVENESQQRGDALLSKFAEIADNLKINLHTDRRTGAPDFLGELAAEEFSLLRHSACRVGGSEPDVAGNGGGCDLWVGPTHDPSSRSLQSERIQPCIDRLGREPGCRARCR